MDKPQTQSDWLWGPVDHSDETPLHIARVAEAFARCFKGPDGETVLGHLRRHTIERAMGADSPDSSLRQLEGQRQLVLRIEALIERGQSTHKFGNIQ